MSVLKFRSDDDTMKLKLYINNNMEVVINAKWTPETITENAY